jgi:GT2 family glycosyltransferase
MRRLSLIVCTHRRPREVELLLRSVAAQSRLPDETLLVDASPDDGTREVANAFRGLEGLRYRAAPPEHRGLTRQRNFGLGLVEGEFVAFLDDDTVLEPTYFAELLACLDRHGDAVGAGGRITNLTRWHPRSADGPAPLGRFRIGEWERREDLRWIVRKCLRLAEVARPGTMPPSGHGRSVGFLPPDGRDHEVEFLLGGAALWRRRLFEKVRFSERFEGYGLYEDLDFCLEARRFGRLMLCTRARLEHHHASDGRPPGFDYGRMVVVNGWHVWRKRWPAPPASARRRWWATTLLLAACRLGDAVRGPARGRALLEAVGRVWGAGLVLTRREAAR